MTRIRRTRFGPLIKWPNLHYPGIPSEVIQFQVVLVKDPTKPPIVHLADREELATVIRKLEKGDTVTIERVL